MSDLFGVLTRIVNFAGGIIILAMIMIFALVMVLIV